MEGFSVRVATAADTPTISRFIRELAEFEQLLHEVVLTPETMRRDLEAGHFECIIAESGGEPVGFALYYHVYSTFEVRTCHTRATP
jgi:hypothetical protein